MSILFHILTEYFQIDDAAKTYFFKNLSQSSGRVGIDSIKTSFWGQTKNIAESFKTVTKAKGKARARLEKSFCRK